jgi:hypothetical protein
VRGTLPYVTAFAGSLEQRLRESDAQALVRYRAEAPDAARAHPTEEHLLPLLVALGAAGEEFTAEKVYSATEGAALAMDAYRFVPASWGLLAGPGFPEAQRAPHGRACARDRRSRARPLTPPSSSRGC